jgi:hypothetical protein
LTVSQGGDAARLRRPWQAGPEAEDEGWLALDDDALLHEIEALPTEHAHDEALLSVVRSNRHFFIRQAAAKKIRDAQLLVGCAQDRHVGQILARRMSRVEDLTYLQHLASESHHLDVRKAAQAQMAHLRAHLGSTLGGGSSDSAEPNPSES